MNLEHMLLRYFATDNPACLQPEAAQAGIEKILVDFGLEPDRGKRFALWSLLHLLGQAPDLDVAFEDSGDREAARNLMDLLASEQERQPD